MQWYFTYGNWPSICAANIWQHIFVNDFKNNIIEWYVKNSMPSTSRFPLTIHVFVYKLGINFLFTSRLTRYVAMSVSFVFDRRLYFTCFYRYKNTPQISHAVLKHFYPSSTFHIYLFSLNFYVEYQLKWNFLLHRISFRGYQNICFSITKPNGKWASYFLSS